jgi:uncharacterized membrane protein YkvA (DUF1232 family)
LKDRIDAMETNSIQKIIADQFDDPRSAVDLQKLLTQVAVSKGANPDEKELAHGLNFIYNYMEQVPYLLTVAWTSARNVGLETEIKSILDMVESYWIEDNDVIPDSLGIIGLLDDAYCSLLSLQTLSDLYRKQTGKFLFPDDLTAANKIMSKIIDEPFITELNAIVSEAVAEANVKDAVKLMASPEKQKLFDSQATIWNHGPVSKLPVKQLACLGLTED